MNEDCILCNPDPKNLIYRGDDGVVLIDGPCRPGHVLVGVRGHHPHLQDVPADQIAAMMQLAVLTSKRIVSLLGAEKTYVVAIGDKDKHFHVHLIPKMAEDPSLGPHVFSGKGWAAFLPETPNDGDVQRVAAELKRILPAASRV